jgi:hypothetical protein
MNLAENSTVRSKWAAILEHKNYAPIRDANRAQVVAQLLENTDFALREDASHSRFELNEASPTNSMGTSTSTQGTGGIDTFDPIMISLIRRSFPNLVAYDLCGVQTMTGPTGLIFALRARYTNQAGTEAFYNEPDTGKSTFPAANATANTLNGQANTTAIGGAAGNLGTIPGVSNNAGNATYNFAGGISTYLAEGLGSNSTAIFPEMSFSVERVAVVAKTRALKAEYSIELAQDLKVIHGQDAEAVLSEILTGEILADINREVIRTINVIALPGSQTDTSTAGIFDLDVDSNGRWSVEKFKGLMFHMEREANIIAKLTRRGKGNIMICSADVASALRAADMLDYTPKLDSAGLVVDDTGNTYAGTVNGWLKVYVDPFAIGGNYFTMGFKGPTPMDSGLFYCPYVPLQQLKAIDPNTFQPKIGYKTRYGMVSNPFAQGTTVGLGNIVQDSNVYYRRTIVQHIM